jgi:hypothetical protein
MSPRVFPQVSQTSCFTQWTNSPFHRASPHVRLLLWEGFGKRHSFPPPMVFPFHVQKMPCAGHNAPPPVHRNRARAESAMATAANIWCKAGSSGAGDHTRAQTSV